MDEPWDLVIVGAGPAGAAAALGGLAAAPGLRVLGRRGSWVPQVLNLARAGRSVGGLAAAPGLRVLLLVPRS